MKKSCVFRWLIGLILLANLHTGCIAPPNPPAMVQITTDRPANQVTYSLAAQTAIFDVESPDGIGEATVTWQEGPLPTRTLLRLHLRGLEELRLTFGDQVQTLALPSSGHGLALQTVAPTDPQTGSEQSITPDNPAWLQTRIVGSTGEATIPRQAGFIEVELPPNVLQGANRTFILRWVDFFR